MLRESQSASLYLSDWEQTFFMSIYFFYHHYSIAAVLFCQGGQVSVK